MAQQKQAFSAKEVPAERRSEITSYSYVPVDPKLPNGKLKRVENKARSVLRQYDVSLPRGNRVRMTEDQMERIGLDPKNPYRVAEVADLTQPDDEMMLAE